MRTIEALVSVAQAKPAVMDIFDEVELGYELAEINGVPAKVLRTREAMMVKQEQDAQNAQDQIDAKNAQMAAGAAKNLGQAAAAAGFVEPAEVPMP